jgi:hypothetical protein
MKPTKPEVTSTEVDEVVWAGLVAPKLEKLGMPGVKPSEVYLIRMRRTEVTLV